MKLNWICRIFKRVKFKKDMWPTDYARSITSKDWPKDRTIKQKKALKKLFVQTVNSKRKTVYDFRTKAMKNNIKNWPIIGYVCPRCSTMCSWADHFLVDEESLCEFCAFEIAKAKNLL